MGIVFGVLQGQQFLFSCLKDTQPWESYSSELFGGLTPCWSSLAVWTARPRQNSTCSQPAWPTAGLLPSADPGSWPLVLCLVNGDSDRNGHLMRS